MSHPVGNASGAFGETAIGTKLPPETKSFLCSTTVTALNVVSIGTDGTIARTATDGTASLVVGIALQGGDAANDSVLCATWGPVVGVPVDGAVSAGSILKRSATTSGSLAATATPAAGEPVAVALAASASNVATVLFCKAF